MYPNFSNIHESQYIQISAIQVYGLAEGKVKIGQMKTHKPSTLYLSESYVTAMCCNPAGNAVVSAHLDGSIYTFFFDRYAYAMYMLWMWI